VSKISWKYKTTKAKHKREFRIRPNYVVSWDSLVGMATNYGPAGRCWIPGKRPFSTPQHPDRFCGPPSLLFNGYLELFPRVQSGQGVKLPIHLPLVPRSRMMELYLHSPYAFMTCCLITSLSTGENLPSLYLRYLVRKNKKKKKSKNYNKILYDDNNLLLPEIILIEVLFISESYEMISRFCRQ
jgi:hypothetical protein